MHSLRCSALDTLCSQAWGSGNPQLVGLHLQRCLLLLLLCHIPVGIVWGFSEQILLALNQEPELSRLASRYLQILFCGMYYSNGNSSLNLRNIGRHMQYSNLRKDFFRPREFLVQVHSSSSSLLLSMLYCITPHEIFWREKLCVSVGNVAPLLRRTDCRGGIPKWDSSDLHRSHIG